MALDIKPCCNTRGTFASPAGLTCLQLTVGLRPFAKYRWSLCPASSSLSHTGNFAGTFSDLCGPAISCPSAVIFATSDWQNWTTILSSIDTACCGCLSGMSRAISCSSFCRKHVLSAKLCPCSNNSWYRLACAVLSLDNAGELHSGKRTQEQRQCYR